MSYVTNILLHLSILEEDDGSAIEQVNAFFVQEGVGPLIGLHETELLPNGWYGGSRYLECHLYVGAFNYLDCDAFLKHLSQVPFVYPEDVQVWIKEGHAEKFRLVHGVEEADPRIVERDQLLCNAETWIADLEKQAQGWELGQLKEWLKCYRQLFPD